jgi:hypothetical protein
MTCNLKQQFYGGAGRAGPVRIGNGDRISSEKSRAGFSRNGITGGRGKREKGERQRIYLIFEARLVNIERNSRPIGYFISISLPNDYAQMIRD